MEYDRTQGGEIRSASVTEPARHPTPAGGRFRSRTRTHSWLSIFTSLAAIVNVLSAIRTFRNGSEIFDGIFRCYAVVVAVFVVVAEMEWEFVLVLKFSEGSGRGMLQIFVAVMTRAYPDHVTKNRKLFLLQSISSYVV